MPAVRRLVHNDESTQLPTEVREIMMSDALMRQDFEEIARWHVVEDEGMVIPDTTVALPAYEVKEIRVPDGVKSYADWGDILITMPQYKGLDVTFADLYTQSFRDVSAETYCRYITGRFSKFVHRSKFGPLIPRDQIYLAI